MYCSQCGKEIPNDSRFCSECGYPTAGKNNTDFEPKLQPELDAVEDIQKKLREIDNRKNTSANKDGKIKTAFEKLKKTIRDEAAASGFTLFFDSFEEEKLEDKKKVIQDYPLPTSPKELACFAKYIKSEIKAKKKTPDLLTPVWKEKLKQVYLFAKKELRSTEAFAEIKKCYKANKRWERHASIRELIILLAVPIVIAFIKSLVYNWPLLLFASILAAGWEIFLILYVYDLLDDMVDSIKQHSAKHQPPKWFRSVAWHLLMPFLAALITSIVYQATGLITLFAVLFGVDAFFLLFFTAYIYDC